MTIGFVGLGIMGSRMAANLQKQGYPLVVHTRTKTSAEALLEGGATWAELPAQAGKQTNILFSMVSTPAAVEAVALGKNGFLNTLKPGSIWVDCTTTNPSFSRRMAAEAAVRQVRFVDAPVAGSKGPAEAGQLLFLVGGAASDLEEIRPYLEAMGQRILHVGAQGMGISLKMVMNMLLGTTMLVFAEAMALGLSLGVDQSLLLDHLLESAVVPPFVRGKRERIEKAAFSPADFPLKWMQKDLQMAAQAASESGASLPMENLAKELYALAVRQGLGEQDFAGIYQLMTGTKEIDGLNFELKEK
jgi:3-hydroxyisobutyrate dehydrogenase-like beta-hydroxyacid dehydrogenase